MEIEGEDGSKIQLKKDSSTDFGRGIGFRTNDRTVSRHHLSLKLNNDTDQTDPECEPRVWFEVIGKNPVWVLSSRSGEIRVFRRFEKGEMEGGDRFCVSGKNPVVFALKRIEIEDELAERLQSSSRSSNGGFGVGEDMGFECIDFSDVDPVKEFGFLVMGHEFDHYPKKMIRDIKNWDWFFEEPSKDSEDDDSVDEKQKRGMRRKRKKAAGNDDDDDWTGGSEDDKELIAKLRKVQKPKYSTRSKDNNKPLKDASGKNSVQKKATCANDEYDENEDEDTLGGFIIYDDNDEVEQNEESDVDEEEEEDYDEDDDDDDDDEIDD